MTTLSKKTNKELLEIVTELATDLFQDEPRKQGMAQAWVAPVVFTDTDSPVINMDESVFGDDVYDLIDAVSVSIDGTYNYYALMTSGWASPLSGTDDETPPSQHPERRRVNLLCLASRNGKQASAMRMSGNPELVTDNGNAKGSLASALADLFA